MRFEKHYTRDQARALLPKIRTWLEGLVELRDKLHKLDQRISELMAPGKDIGGPVVNQWARSFVDVKRILLEFHVRDIQLKDLDRGLIDFPAIIEDREVFLCWELQEEDIGFWHDLDAGYAGREPLSGEDL
ncbi:MAG TPA: DUF2203 domain-containing protein [Verrucomicrobiae bacterium]|nr:DUF2203 domain-containing protein [Verrucomicrobiae bacterium]